MPIGIFRTFLRSGSVWYNELGSVMRITEVCYDKGTFSGTYCSAVGDATKKYLLSGRFNNEGHSLGWAVTYKNQYENAHSTAAWSGQIQVNPGIQQPIILTTWLLTSETLPSDDWASTQVGFDTFMQKEPTKEVIQQAQLRGKHSCPSNA